jgi:hypothetical protein
MLEGVSSDITHLQYSEKRKKVKGSEKNRKNTTKKYKRNIGMLYYCYCLLRLLNNW